MVKINYNRPKITIEGHNNCAEDAIKAVLYGKDITENLHFYIDNNFTEYVKTYGKSVINSDITIQYDNKKYNTIIREIQYHPITNTIMHVDFFAYQKNKNILIQLHSCVPNLLELPNLKSAILLNKQSVFVKVNSKNIPFKIEVDGSQLSHGSKVFLNELVDKPHFLFAVQTK